MKKRILIIMFIAFAMLLTSCTNNANGNYQLSIKNNIDGDITDNYVELDLNKTSISNFEKMNFIVSQNGEVIPSQKIGNDKLGFVIDLKAQEEKVITVQYGEQLVGKEYTNRTYAEIAMKVDYEKIDGKYTGGRFQNFDKLRVPDDHIDHNALFKYEGPGWESEVVGYRLYIDWRNRTDIFGKTVNQLVLQEVGVNDIHAKDDSYHNMQHWGKDLFKVGSSLGIGSFGMMANNEIVMLSERDSVYVEIPENGPVKSSVVVDYYGWKVNESTYDLKADFSITAGSRLTEVTLSLNNNPENIVTGFAKHPDTEFSTHLVTGGWSYISLFGKQVVADADKPDQIVDDNLGIAVIFHEAKLLEQTENENSYVLVLTPTEGIVKYYFAAAWDKEPNGFNSKAEFENYLNKVIDTLNNSITLIY